MLKSLWKSQSATDDSLCFVCRYQHAGVGVGMEAALVQTGGKAIPTAEHHESEGGGSGLIMLMTVLQLRRHMAFVVDNLH